MNVFYDDGFKEKVLADYKAGVNISRLAEKYHVSRVAIYRWLESANLYPSRDPWDCTEDYKAESDSEGVPDQDSITFKSALADLLSKADDILGKTNALDERLAKLEEKADKRWGRT